MVKQDVVYNLSSRNVAEERPLTLDRLIQAESLTEEQISDYKHVFSLFVSPVHSRS